MSYRKKHIKGKIHKIKPKKSIFKMRWPWITFLSLIIVFSALYFFLFYSGVQVKNIIIFGNHKVASKDLENLISDNINNKILSIGDWEINSKSIFLVNSARLDQEIQNKFTVIESVEINKEFMQTLELQVRERAPVAVFCPKQTDDDCFSIDEKGIAFESSAILPADDIIVRQATNNGQIFTGKEVVQQNIMDLILKLEKDLKDNYQINLKTALIASLSRLNATTNENWQIYFDLSADSDIDSQLTKLNLLLSGQISADSRKNLRYIDLRPKDRAIVCDNMECGSPH